MEAFERDTTRDWLLPQDAAPPLLGELEKRIDEALDTARAAAAEVRAVGVAAFDAAEQAKRAAAEAERASAAAVEASQAAAGVRPEDASLRGFSERADRVVERLRALERRPRRRVPSALAGRR